MAKIGIIGTGFVGATSAYALLLSGIADELVLIDANEKRAHGEMLDLTHSMPLCPPARVSCNNWNDLAGCDIIVLTAGANQMPGQTRLELANRNIAIFGDIVPKAVNICPEAVYLVVTNPVDVLTLETVRLSGLPDGRVIGSGTVLDSNRLKNLLSDRLNVDPRSVHSFVLGEHGDSEFAAWSLANVAGMPLDTFWHMTGHVGGDILPELQRDFERHVKNAAYTIIDEKGATYYAVGTAVRRICEAILRNEHSILPVSTLLHGEFGLSNVCLSLPAIVGRNGAERLFPIRLTEDEERRLHLSAENISRAYELQNA